MSDISLLCDDCGNPQYDCRCGLLYLVVDTKAGGLDGWYATQSMANDAMEYWKQIFGHDKFVVAKAVSKATGIGSCFMSDKRAREAIAKRISGQQ